MAIDQKDVTTSITLELDREDLPIDQFKMAVEQFFGLVKEVAKDSCPRKNSSSWLVRVYPGSAGIGVVRKPGTYTDDEEAIIRAAVLEGLRQLEKGKRPSTFTDKAIEHSRKLSRVLRSRKVPAAVRVWGDHGEPFVFTRTVTANAAQFLEAVYEDEGSIDGFLEKLNAHGQFEFVVYDVLDDRPISCEVEEAQLEAAWAAFRRRVEVTGIVRYRRDGLPVSIKAKEITPFPKAEEVPSLEEIRTLLAEGP